MNNIHQSKLYPRYKGKMTNSEFFLELSQVILDTIKTIMLIQGFMIFGLLFIDVNINQS